MLHIKCPHCGLRSQNEFSYGGDATVKRPELNKDGKWSLEATVYGDKIHVNKQSMRVDVKAITYHHFKVEEKNGKWQAFVVLDI